MKTARMPLLSSGKGQQHINDNSDNKGNHNNPVQQGDINNNCNFIGCKNKSILKAKTRVGNVRARAEIHQQIHGSNDNDKDFDMELS
ncbi:hypothetical protein PoB_007237500 [Plakobranchus ocellatus]|uniref:Uncharacterized protein n=1 Tax=Plakobranchus ocellatus TaxID=259542 RepID=A0AAV4DP83_9GAST|nr:hypothetical protein PoB_007237500 [Plakobranchus ocellatus]